jgi:hypothetical protein
VPAAPLQPDHVFINCPFDAAYEPLFNAIVFGVYSASFKPRCAWEESDASRPRLDKIMAMIRECRFGIHDISRTELDSGTGLPRFNMPFELGLFLGCKGYGGRGQTKKSCLVFDRELYRYQQFLSDIAGQDITPHGGDPERALRAVRDWLRTASGKSNIPGGDALVERYRAFQVALPAICRKFQYEHQNLIFADRTTMIVVWLSENPL